MEKKPSRTRTINEDRDQEEEKDFDIDEFEAKMEDKPIARKFDEYKLYLYEFD